MNTTIDHPITRPATGKQTDEFRQRVERFVRLANARWCDEWTNRRTGEMPAKLRDLCSTWQLHGHLAKWAWQTGRLDESLRPANLKVNQRDGLNAAVFLQDEAAVVAELRAYVTRLAEEKRAAVLRAHPELFPEEWADAEGGDE